MAIPYATFEISSACNMDCPFCFSGWRDQAGGEGTVDTQTAKEILAKMRVNGLEAINFTGGEPLLRHDLPEIAAYAKDLGLMTILSTNGILLERTLPRLASSLDYVGLPLDSSLPEIHRMMRLTRAVDDHHALIVHLLDHLPQTYPTLGIKINTVVSAVNETTISGIAEIIEGKADAWKLSRFLPEGYGKGFADMYSITHARYQSVVDTCRTAHPSINIVMTDSIPETLQDKDPDQRIDDCRIISNAGHLLKPEGGRLIDLGDIVTMSAEEMSRGLDERANRAWLHATYRPNRGNQSGASHRGAL